MHLSFFFVPVKYRICITQKCDSTAAFKISLNNAEAGVPVTVFIHLCNMIIGLVKT